MADTRTFACTDLQIAGLTAALAKHGLSVDLTKGGEATQGKWDIAWQRSACDITIEVKAHPFGEDEILWGRVAALLGSTG